MNLIDTSSPAPEQYPEESWWFVVAGNHIMVVVDPDEPKKATAVPRLYDPRQWGLTLLRDHFLGYLDGVACYAAEIERDAVLPANHGTVNLRRLYGQLSDEFTRVAGRAVQIIDWDRNNVFCGRCGDRTVIATDRAKVCPSCKLRAYPRLSPAVIMLIRNGDKLLLAHSKRHPKGLYSVLAGFAEPGETLEECVAREIREEVGLEVENIRYFGSQPWPFPDSLMIGFTCDYAGGEIDLRDDEIAEADWYTVDT
ncbi:MAG: NAD(+) diphosphatase, partial [Sphaerospermopsis sp. SIO1G2]|nr:NAD(+) diphosphatase [Sphaerospermopsis sp. SIO1G2]